MAEDVLKQFVLALGFDMKSNEQAKFEGAITSAVVKANLATEALLAAAEAAAKFAAKLIGSFDELYYASGRTGASVQNIKALQYAFTQVGGSAQSAMAAVEAFAKAQRTNPGVRQFVDDLGIKRSGDAVVDLMASIETIRQKNPYATGALMAGLLGISEEQFNLFDQNAANIKVKFAEINQLRNTFGVNSEKIAKQSAVFSAAIGRLASVSEVAGEKLLEVFLPSIERMTAVVSNWLNSHPEEIEKIFNAIGYAVDLTGKAFGYLVDKGTDLFQYLSDRASEMNEDGSFLRMWEKVAAVFDRVVRAIQNVITWLKEIDRATDMSDGLKQIGRILGWVDASTSGTVKSGFQTLGAIDQDTDGGVGVPGTKPEGIKGAAREWVKKNMPSWLGGDAAGTGSKAAPLGKIGRNENAQTIIKTLRNAGYGNNAIAAVVGSMQTESSFNPRAANSVAGGIPVFGSGTEIAGPR